MTTKKVILITGASSGIGESIAIHLTEKGYIVYGVSRSISNDKIFRTIKMDVCDRGSIDNGVRRIIEEEGRIDILINNAGLRSAGPLEYISQEEFQRVFETNVHSVLKLCQATLPIMRRQGSGLIINMSSLSSEHGWPFQASYCASKAALDRLTESLSAELAGTNIQICRIQPGNVRTGINKNMIVSPQPIDSVYQFQWQKCDSAIKADTLKGVKTSRINALIERIINSPNVKIKYKIGTLLDLSSIVGKRTIPGRLYEKIINAHFGI